MKPNQRLRTSTRLSATTRKLVGGICLAALVGIGIFFGGNFSNPSNSLGAPGKHGALTVSAANTKINEFTYLTASSVAGSSSITVNSVTMNANSRFSGNLTSGELLMIIQMQGATYSTSNNSSYGNITSYGNAGLYEFAEVTSISGSTITLSAPLKNSYTHGGKVQVVRVPRYTTLTVNSGASITSDAWDGTKGGIVAIEVSGTTVIDGTIDVSQLGFKGGVVYQGVNNSVNAYCSSTFGDGAEKGESIGGSTSSYSKKYCRSGVANGGGGGNGHNAGGGGGANGGVVASWTGTGNPDTTISSWKTAWNLESSGFASSSSSGGGRGGYGWSAASLNPTTTAPGNALWLGDSRQNTGGFGGRPLDYSGGRIFFGGGGGAGNSNNNNGTSGGNGGGIVFLLGGGNISGSGTIKANGQSVAITGNVGNGDACGGGGGGGTVIVYLKSATLNNLSIQANGGNGGSQDIAAINNPETEAPGGGGSGGYVALTNKINVTISVNGGANGVTNSIAMSAFPANGATKGGVGTANGTAPTNPYSGVSTLPVELTSFTATKENNIILLKWSTASEIDNDYFCIERSTDETTYQEIGKIKGNGNSTAKHDYHFVDSYPLTGISYYRLRQIDFNGIQEIFKPVSVSMNAKLASFRINGISPNPFKETFMLTYTTDNQLPINIQVTTLNGQLVYQEKLSPSEGINQYQFDHADHLKSGLYFITIKRDGADPVSLKIIKQ